MTLMILDPGLEERLIEERRAWGADKYDEVWEGVYVMAPLPDNEHQEIAARLIRILDQTLGDADSAQVRPGVNLASFNIEDWKQDFRAPDVAVFRKDTEARDCDSHWRGPADLLVEITSKGDRTRQKIPFYSRIGVVELLIVERQGWTLELYRHDGEELKQVGASSLEKPDVLRSERSSLTFQLVPGPKRPRIRVTDSRSGQSWEA